ncbi:MAG: Response regulator receiver protein [Berkelbacteria bacterium GW2011_GWA1_36_9]|uniref:Response regulator receiver protein n=1 Tax=Berkelbacteria bacterium GW2011_GWA1_36_9 TaxID=1618331 RepID=A0A0G0FWT6_9BACT|nr:MAG: Response regulator receiver protein [Berkelbacteria bacterium GW2011_GWA1_36_9]
MANITKVLMVDDDKMLLDMYKERIQLAGFQVETSSNGEECLAKIHHVKPDIVLLDIMMPKVNGYETLASIKSDPQTKDIPVIILSALVRDINKGRAIEAGADDYIIKSEVMPADVIKKIENVLSKYHKKVVATPVTEAVDVEPEDKNPIPPVVPPVATSSTPPPPAPPQIQFEPSVQTATSVPSLRKKPSSLVLFFLILIVFLIILSDIFFYLRFLKI